MASGRARTYVRNLGDARRLSYIPPNGRWLEAGETVIVPGILETEVYLGKNEAFDDYEADISAGLVNITYDFAADSGTPDVVISTLTQRDKNLIPNTTLLANGQDTGISISITPCCDSMVDVVVNGLEYSLGDGVKTEAFYFSSDGGVTALNIDDIMLGSRLYMNCALVGFSLDGTDRVSLRYMELEEVSSSSSSSSL